MKDCILCIDIGTTSLKAAFMSGKPEKVFVSRQKLETGRSNEWLPALSRAVKELKEKNPECAVEAVCISGNGPTIVSEDGTTLLHNDNLNDAESILKNSGRSPSGQAFRPSASAPLPFCTANGNASGGAPAAHAFS